VPNLKIQLYRDRFAAIEEELRSRVLGFVLLSISTDILKGALKERNLPWLGRKFELAARLIAFATAEQENQELLAIDVLDLHTGAADIAEMAAAEEEEEQQDIDCASDEEQ
jgi:hypothetical protein